ncbi:SWIM zinc finger domain-containing protein [Blastopirellula sp. JC732]|uniref:SWIM zinc finger domain-containing protein n=1 Tax=Blastopirellula sediminis TaxID=2894196 RepID=A0A9X1SLD0_9BACT|nr:SWIM zinc finger family protein [Blastopirellula sediminis]MCC9606132.1 SWIM zinc finger domain-containing protein [Blastopirellula sediminis]MCC9630569.1 SWIM zinc finger domain-containing protein [Blastopirellula sediminis]
MSALVLDYSYTYLQPSQLDPAAHQLQLATSSEGVDPHPYFFCGKLVRPKRVAEMLRKLMEVVRSRFHMPAAMLTRILAMSDPIVTSSDDRLRFEGFSSCCGVYVRVDLHPRAVDGEVFGRGTTNVDFNEPMLAALALVRENDEVSLSVGADHVALAKNDQTVIEKRVKLPYRWLRGLVEVQACQSRMRQVHQISGVEARRFLRSLPRSGTSRREMFVTAAGSGLRLAQRETAQSVRVGGLQRLRVLEDLSTQARQLRIYTDQATGASGWELLFDDSRFQLVISPEVWRGFSGEGQALTALATQDDAETLAKVESQLRWEAVIDEASLATQLGVSPDVVRQALVVLGTRGRVGFDLGEGSYFHRELPYRLEDAEKLQPRLKNARKLIEEGKVRRGATSKEEVEIFVKSGPTEHRVRLSDDNAKCSCPWYAKHGSSRGPCKHILAASIYWEEGGDE